MKVALEKGEVLEVALLENDKVVGILSFELKGVGVAPVSRAAASSSASAAKRGRNKKRYVSPEARARMADAQRRRWERFRSGKGKK
jgi:hypothetical protein